MRSLLLAPFDYDWPHSLAGWLTSPDPKISTEWNAVLARKAIVIVVVVIDTLAHSFAIRTAPAGCRSRKNTQKTQGWWHYISFIRSAGCPLLLATTTDGTRRLVGYIIIIIMQKWKSRPFKRQRCLRTSIGQGEEWQKEIDKGLANAAGGSENYFQMDRCRRRRHHRWQVREKKSIAVLQIEWLTNTASEIDTAKATNYNLGARPWQVTTGDGLNASTNRGVPNKTTHSVTLAFKKWKTQLLDFTNLILYVIYIYQSSKTALFSSHYKCCIYI